MSNSGRPHRQPTRLLCPWDSLSKNTGVGCHFLLQCMKVKSESEVAQSCSTLCNAMDFSPPGSSIHGIFQARVLEWVAIAFSVRMANLRYIYKIYFCHHGPLWVMYLCIMVAILPFINAMITTFMNYSVFIGTHMKIIETWSLCVCFK